MFLNGVELEFDFYDADQMELFEDAFEKARIDMDKAFNAQKQSELIRGVCQATINMIDEIFGDGTANEVFQGETNFKKSMQVFNDLVKEKIKQEEEVDNILKEMRGMTEKYAVQPNNRQIRRANKKN
ncbi:MULTISPECIES: DUF6673 family protein [Clostridia]|uniref:DUF6673 family protein n=1 Tax=Clostridia TaxID=186801 RepID=UPI002A8F2DF9|nr:DUF6673 family protein [Peptostreptococcus porci]MDY5098795.1 DUF6673 family protein [Clostridium sp.]MDY5437460.1 DUF6673 family protein [Peptostreptococcus porci]